MKRLFFITAFCMLLIGANAQKEGNIWYFGDKAGIDFNSGAAVAITNSAMSTSEGCSSICDANGNLLFYTDGVSVWDSTHAVMPNGDSLLGNSSSTQSALIVKKPKSNSIYYLFTVDVEAGPNGMVYSEVDMSLQGGLGDVNANKNIQFVTPVCEKITGIRHQNGVDVWIVVHRYNSNTFESYLLSSTGLSITPVSTSIGVIVNRPHSTIGYLKASRDGSRLASVNYSVDNLELFDFDKATGRLSNAMSFSGFSSAGYDGVYGVEFSPNGNLLYVSNAVFSSSSSKIFQYNLLAGNQSQAAIALSRFTVGTMQMASALQSAPDGKIYNSNQGSALDVINNPNVLGMGCNFVPAAFSLNGKYSSFGLTNFINDIFNPNFLTTNLCFGDSTQFSIRSNYTLDSVLWDFGDPTSGVFNASKDTAALHLFSDTGTFNVTLTSYSNGFPTTTNQPIYIAPLPKVNLGNDTTLCTAQNLILNAAFPNATYLWSNNTTGTTFNVTQQGNYWVEVNNGACTNSDTINVSYNAPPLVNLGNDTSVCNGQNVFLDASSSNGLYLWSNNSTSATLNVTQPGVYWVDVTNDCGTSRDSIVVSYTPLPIVNLGNDTTLCNGQSLLLDATLSNVSYAWQDNATTSTFNVSQQGVYWVDVTNKCGTTRDSIVISYTPLPVVDLGNDTVLCLGENVVLNGTFPTATYWWQDGSSNPTFEVSDLGVYWVRVVAKGCVGFDTILVEEGDCEYTIIIPNVFSPNNDGHNELFKVLTYRDEPFSMLIYNRWGQKLYETTQLNDGWDGRTTAGRKSPEGTYFYIIHFGEKTHKGSFSLLR